MRIARRFVLTSGACGLFSLAPLAGAAEAYHRAEAEGPATAKHGITLAVPVERNGLLPAILSGDAPPPLLPGGPPAGDPVPEPSLPALVGVGFVGALGFGLLRRRLKRPN